MGEPKIGIERLTVEDCRRMLGEGRIAQGLEGLQALEAIDPDNAALHHYLGVALHLAGRSREALPHFEKALALEPDQAAVYQNQAIALLTAGEAGKALAAAERSIALRPKAIGGYVNLALAQAEMRRPEEALRTVRRGLEIAPGHPGLLIQAAHLAIEAQRWDEAEDLVAASLAAAPGSVDVLFNAAILHQNRGRDEDALRQFEILLKKEPRHRAAFVNAGIVLRNLGRLDKAIRHFAAGLEVWPDWDVLKYNIAITRLSAGQWQQAWDDYELRFAVANPLARSPRPASPRWDGAEIGGKTLLVVHEQGFGDVFQCVRMLAFACEKAERVIFACPPRLFGILSRLDMFGRPGLRLVSSDAPLPAHDVHLYLLSLLRLAHVAPERMPGGIARIDLEPARLETWRAFAANAAKPWRVGLALQVHPQPASDKDRSFAAAELAPLARVADRVQFVSLQRLAGVDAPFPDGLDARVPGDDFDAGEEGFLNAAAMMMSLDLVITADTAIAHLAGLLGRPVWLCLGKAPDWRWGVEGMLTPWYPTMRLFRQTAAGGWQALIADIADALDRLAVRPVKQPPAAAQIAQAIDRHVRGRTGEALAVYHAAAAFRKADAQFLNYYAMAILEEGKRGAGPARAGLPFVAHSVALRPDIGDHWSNFAVLLDSLGAGKDAIRALRFGLAASPGHVPSQISLAKKMSAEGAGEQALAILKEVITRHPKSVAALSALSTVYMDGNKPREAERALRRALDIDPDDAKLWVQLGANQSAGGKHAESADSWERALSADPANADAWSNLGVYERNYGETGLAIYFQRRGIECDPQHAEGWNNLGIAELEAAHEPQAMAAFTQAFTVRPGYADAHLAFGMALLNGGDYERGFKHYEWRLRSEKLGIGATRQKIPMWSGGDPKGLSIFLMAEQGFGDAFQFSRYALWLKERGAARVFVGCRRLIAHLMASIPGIDGVFSDGERLPRADVMAFMMSMPGLTGLRPDTVPAYESYLAADPARVARWAEWLDRKPGFRVGVVWQGNPDPKVDKGRSYPLSALEPLAKIPGIRLIALQKGAGEEQLDALGGRFAVERPGPDFDAGRDAFADTAAMMMNLDLVVTSDTAVAHLAGALGRPCWVVLKAHPEWRWQRQRSDTPWYPMTRLFRRFDREVEATPFAAVMGRVAAALEKLAAGDLSQHHVSAPAVPGEIAAFDPVAVFNDALAAQRKGDTAAADAGFAQVLDYQKLRLGALHMLGVSALHRDRNHRAALLFREAERAGLSTSEFLTNFSISLRRTGRIEDALSYLRKAIAHKPTAEAYLSLGNILRDECRWDESFEAYQSALAIKPNLSKVHRGIANLMRDIHRPDDSLAAFETARSLDQTDPDLLLDHAHAKLFAGDFIGGFRDYEARWGSREMRARHFDMPRWDGTPEPGKTLMIHGEQGFGDNIQFARFIGEAARRVGHVTVEVRGPLLGLFGRLDAGAPITVLEQGRAKPQGDFEIPILSLPTVFGTTIDTVPPPAHFRIPPERVAVWRERFAGPGLKVGLVWQGNPKARADQGRSPPLAELAPLLQIPGATFVSLQKSDGLDQIADSPAAAGMIVPGQALGDFAETAAAILALDLVISSCTATLHLAASLGVPVFGMLKYHADWRWLNERDDSPWYPSLRLFRQKVVHDWKSVVEPLAAALREKIGGA